MSSRITIRRNFKFADIIKITEADMRKAGLDLAVRIENRTASGLDEDRRSFAPYSPAYAKTKLHEPGSSPTVDLHRTGRMFDDLDVIESSDRHFKLGFRTDESAQLAAWHEAGAGHLPVRKFLGVPASWIKDTVRALKALIG